MKRARDKEEEEDDDTTDHAAKIPFIEHSSGPSPLFPPFLPGELWCVVAGQGNFAECAGDSHMSDGMSTFLLEQTCRAINLSLTSMRKKLSRPQTLPWLMKYHAAALVAWGLEIEPEHDPRFGISLLHIGLRRRPMSTAGLKPFWFGWPLGQTSVRRWRTLACWYGQVAMMRAIELDLVGTDGHDLFMMAIEKQDVPMLSYFLKESGFDDVPWTITLVYAILDQPGLFERLDPIIDSRNIFTQRRRAFRSMLITTHYANQLSKKKAAKDMALALHSLSDKGASSSGQ